MLSNIDQDSLNKETSHSEEIIDCDQFISTNLPAKSIKAIDKGTVHRICSGQVVLSLAVAVKELVENSLDAHATCIEIRLKDYGSSLIEISDNGSGVQPHDFIGLALKHYTSKLESFENLVSVKTYGFRGEALSSLCALSNMTVTTRHRKQLTGARLSYNHNGQLIKEVPISRNEGTTVSLQNIFCTLPVRHKEFTRNLKKEFNKMIQILYSYCLIASNVRISCTNQCDKGKISTIVSTEVHSMMKENIVSIFGVKQLSSLLKVIQKDPSSEALSKYGVPQQTNVNSDKFFKLEGYVSSCAHGLGRSMADRQFFYINNRPCDPIKITRVVNEVYHHYNKNQFPMIVLNIQMKDDDVDINVTPDKRKIFVNRENFLLATIKSTLDFLYNSIPSTYCIQQDLGNFCVPNSELNATSNSKKRLSILSEKFACPIKSSPASKFIQNSNDCIKRPISENVEQMSSESKKLKLQEFCFTNAILPNVEVNGNGINHQEKDAAQFGIVDDEDFVEDLVTSSKPLVNGTFISNNHKQISKLNSVISHNDYSEIESSSVNFEKPLIFIDPADNKNNFKNKAINTVSDRTSLKYSQANSRTDDFINNLLSKKANISSNIKNKLPHSKGLAALENKTDFEDILSIDNSLIDLDDGPTSDCHVILEEVDNTGRPINFASERVRSLTVQFTLASLKEKLKYKKEMRRNKELLMRKFRATISPMDNKTAEDELKKEVSKAMFKEMSILGQFNLGFIISRLGPDLFIIDQHATDEKYNFEMLKNNYVIKNQKLINPQLLDLTVVNESILMDNLDIFTKNGFEFKINEHDQLGKRVLLVAIPCSRGWEFGKEDIEEMIFMLSDSPGEFCRPSRVRSMFASRACRKSVMIGTALSVTQMRTLVDHMGEIEQPWNCPHGRPTMRHLVNLDVVAKASL